MAEGTAEKHTTHACKDRNTRKWVHTSFFVMLNEIWLVGWPTSAVWVMVRGRGRAGTREAQGPTRGGLE